MSALAWGPPTSGMPGVRLAASGRRARTSSSSRAAPARVAAPGGLRLTRRGRLALVVLVVVAARRRCVRASAAPVRPSRPATVTVDAGPDPVRGRRRGAARALDQRGHRRHPAGEPAEHRPGQRRAAARHPAGLTAAPGARLSGVRVGPTDLSPSTRLRTPKGVAPVQGSDALRAVCWGRWCRCGGSIPAASAERPHRGVACTVSATGALRLRVRGVARGSWRPPVIPPHQSRSKGWCPHAPSSAQVPRDHDGGGRSRRRAHRTSRPGCPGRPRPDAADDTCLPRASLPRPTTRPTGSTSSRRRASPTSCASRSTGRSSPDPYSIPAARGRGPSYVLAVARLATPPRPTGLRGARRRATTVTRR